MSVSDIVTVRKIKHVLDFANRTPVSPRTIKELGRPSCKCQSIQLLTSAGHKEEKMASSDTLLISIICITGILMSAVEPDMEVDLSRDCDQGKYENSLNLSMAREN
jgi:hypothetical protein